LDESKIALLGGPCNSFLYKVKKQKKQKQKRERKKRKGKRKKGMKAKPNFRPWMNQNYSFGHEIFKNLKVKVSSGKK
jgi:hypothetical protein